MNEITFGNSIVLAARPAFISFLFLLVMLTLPAKTRGDELTDRFMKAAAAGDYQTVADVLQQMMKRYEGMMGASPEFIGLGVTRGAALRNLAKYDEAEAQLNETLASAKRHLGNNHEVVASALSALAGVRQLQGEFNEAGKLYQQAIAILEKLGADVKTQRAEVYTNFGTFLSETGEPVRARKYLEVALTLNRKEFGDQHVRTLATLNNLGRLLNSMGDLDEAEKTLRESLDLHQKTLGQDHIETATALNNYALVLVAQERGADAIPYYEKAVGIYQSEWGNDHPNSLTAVNNLGQIYIDQGQSKKAIPLLEDTLKRRERVLGESHPGTATTQTNLGAANMDLGNLAEAKTLLTSATKTFGKSEGGAIESVANSRSLLGGIAMLQNDPLEAIQQFDAGHADVLNAVWKILPTLDNNAQQKFMKWTFRATLAASLSTAFEFPDDQNVIDATAQWAANAKGIATEALAAARRNHTDAELMSVQLDQIRSEIPDDGVWIDVVQHGVLDVHGATYLERQRDPRYSAWIVFAKGNVVHVDLGEAGGIDKLVDAVRETSNAAAEMIAERGEIEATDLAKEKLADVSKLVWQPLLAKLPNDTKKILLSPDGALWLLPWAAMPVDDEMLIQRYSLSTYVSGRMLVEAKQERPGDVSPSAVFSNPNFDQNGSEKRAAYTAVFRRSPAPFDNETRSFMVFDREQTRATPLPGTAVEAAAIMPSMTQWLDGKKPVHYEGKFALESIAKRMVSPRTLVFATHGFFRDDDARAFDPLSRCGLLLAGFNDVNSVTADDDGILTGAEIADINLRGTELVVLSACETGVGRVENGNGIAGLRRAFHLAGASNVVSTLWQIPDFDSAKLMGEFFAEIAKGTSKDEALRQAQIRRIESRTERNGAAHPYFWAGFSVSGN